MKKTKNAKYLFVNKSDETKKTNSITVANEWYNCGISVLVYKITNMRINGKKVEKQTLITEFCNNAFCDAFKNCSTENKPFAYTKRNAKTSNGNAAHVAAAVHGKTAKRMRRREKLLRRRMFKRSFNAIFNACGKIKCRKYTTTAADGRRHNTSNVLLFSLPQYCGGVVDNGIITTDNIYSIAAKMVIGQLNKIYAKSAMPFILDLRLQAIIYAAAIRNGNAVDCIVADGSDLIQDVALFLSQHINEHVDNIYGLTNRYIRNADNNIVLDYHGNAMHKTATLLNKCGYIVREHMHMFERDYTKRIYLDDNNGNATFTNVVAVDDFTTATEINNMIAALKLPPQQYNILMLRLNGIAVNDKYVDETDENADCKRIKEIQDNCAIRCIAKFLGVTKQTVQTTLRRIQDKYIAVYGLPQNVDLHKTNIRKTTLNAARERNTTATETV